MDYNKLNERTMATLQTPRFFPNSFPPVKAAKIPAPVIVTDTFTFFGNVSPDAYAVMVSVIATVYALIVVGYIAPEIAELNLNNTSYSLHAVHPGKVEYRGPDVHPGLQIVYRMSPKTYANWYKSNSGTAWLPALDTDKNGCNEAVAGEASFVLLLLPPVLALIHYSILKAYAAETDKAHFFVRVVLLIVSASIVILCVVRLTFVYRINNTCYLNNEDATRLDNNGWVWVDISFQIIVSMFFLFKTVLNIKEVFASYEKWKLERGSEGTRQLLL